MKAPILIATCVLVLLAASLSPRPSRRETGKVKSETVGERADSPVKPPVRLAAKPVTNPSNEYVYNYYHSSPSDIWTILVAVSTALIAIFTIALWRTSARQWQVADKSLTETKKANDLARKTLLITQRPALRLRNVVVQNARQSGMSSDPTLFRQNQYVSGQFYVSNNGGSKAAVTESLCMVWWNQGELPNQRPYEGHNGNNPIAVGTVIEPGGVGITVGFSSDRPLGNEATRIWQGSDLWRLYVMGWIEYSDEVPVTRRMAFCRVFSVSDGRRFVPVQNPDYEHGEE